MDISKIKLSIITSPESLANLINQVGFLPFFKNEAEGFSLEEHIDRRYWFPNEGDGVWEWKGPVIQLSGCAYGKFFHGKAAFISREWFPDFANYRRNGYDFDALYDDGMAKRIDKQVYEIIEKNNSLLSKEVKKQGDFVKGGNKGFDSVITRLQMQGYMVISDFEYEKDRQGNLYGWGVARYELPEYRFGDDFTERVYQREPEESFDKIMRFLGKMYAKEDMARIEKMLRKGAVKE